MASADPTAPSKLAPPPILYSFPTPALLSVALAEFVLAAQDDALSKRPKATFKIALSGGSLPAVLGGGLVGLEGVKWDRWEVFFADERLVALDHADSNYAALHASLFSKVPIPASQIHVIDVTKLDDPEACAEEYEKQLVGAFVGKETVAFPRFDLCLLGIGPDGHTCSLFPSHPLLLEEDVWVASLVDSPKPPSARITLTYPVLNHSHRVAFVASGAGKQEILRMALDGGEADEGEPLPCARVKVKNPGRVYYFSDEAGTAKVKYERTPFKL